MSSTTASTTLPSSWSTRRIGYTRSGSSSRSTGTITGRPVVPDELTIGTVPGRWHERGDPWAAIGARLQSIEPLLDVARQDTAAGLHDAPWPPEYPKGADEPTRVAPSRAKKGD